MSRVRLADGRDAQLLATLGARLFAQTFASRNRPEDLDAYLRHAFSIARQASELADARMRTWIAETADGEPIGYAQLRLDTPPPTQALNACCELARIYADSAWHGRGVGATLLQTVLSAARDAGARHIWLGVWKNNPRGIAFYEKNGFRIVGEQLFQLGADTQHDWIMLRALEDGTSSTSR